HRARLACSRCILRFLNGSISAEVTAGGQYSTPRWHKTELECGHIVCWHAGATFLAFIAKVLSSLFTQVLTRRSSARACSGGNSMRLRRVPQGIIEDGPRTNF